MFTHLYLLHHFCYSSVVNPTSTQTKFNQGHIWNFLTLYLLSGIDVQHRALILKASTAQPIRLQNYTTGSNGYENITKRSSRPDINDTAHEFTGNCVFFFSNSCNFTTCKMWDVFKWGCVWVCTWSITPRCVNYWLKTSGFYEIRRAGYITAVIWLVAGCSPVWITACLVLCRAFVSSVSRC